MSEELSAQSLEIVDLAVEHELDRAIFVGERLVGACAQVDDPQAAETQTNLTVRGHKEPGIIGTSMDELFAHRLDQIGVHASFTREPNLTTNATHKIENR